MKILTQTRLRELLDYDPATGVFRWRNPTGPKHQGAVGEEAGCVDVNRAGHKRCRIRINRRLWPAANLAWVWMTGVYPPDTVDHINQQGDDNRWKNLRLADHGKQMINRRNWGAYPRGVSKYAKRYVARITQAGVTYHLGSFDTVEAASTAYEMAAYSLHGSFYKGEVA
jgi:hypothetical protein